MKITQLQITSSALDLEFSPNAPVCVLCGRYSDLALDLIRATLDNHTTLQVPKHIDDGQFVIHADIEMDGKSYAVCSIRNMDYKGDSRIAVNFGDNSTNFSLFDTYELVGKLEERNKDESNVFDIKKYKTDICLSEGDRLVAGFEQFCGQLRADDDRPIFIPGFFDRIDEATEIGTYLDALASLGRQVFVSVGPLYPIQRLTHSAIQLVSIEGNLGTVN